MRVLVTGGSGFLGREVVHQLTTSGHDVVALSRAHISHLNGLPVVHGDLTDTTSIREALLEVAPVQAICHLAALTQARASRERPLAYWDVNTAGTLRILQAVADQSTHARVVLASSGAVYGDGLDGPIPENAPTAPTSPYGRSKAAAEALLADAVAAGVVTGVVIRTFNLAGSSRGLPDTDTSRVIPGALAVANGERDAFTVNGFGDVVREYTHVSDVARAYVAAIDQPMSDQFTVYNIGSGRASSVLDVLNAVRAVTGYTIPIEYGPGQHEPASLVADVTRAAQDLGWVASRSNLTDLVADAWNALLANISGAAHGNR